MEENWADIEDIEEQDKESEESDNEKFVLPYLNSEPFKTWTTSDGRNVECVEKVYGLIEKDLHERCPQRTPEWYEKRKNHITASSIASVIGHNYHESRKVCFDRKVGKGQPFKGNCFTKYGNDWEDTAIRRYEEETGEKVFEFGLLESLNPNEGFIAGSPDGITASGRLIEVKCPLKRKIQNKIPKHYVPQVQCLLNILNLEVCDFVQFHPEDNFTEEILSITTVKRDREFWTKVCVPELRKFWEEVKAYRIGKKTKNNPFSIFGTDDDDEEDDDEEDDDEEDDLSTSSEEYVKISPQVSMQTKKRGITVNEGSGIYL
jgi:putative phage-type endonuclease